MPIEATSSNEHIADFGGDPSQVTIFGGSAGAGSVRAILATKLAFGLFHGAIAQSNLGGYGFASTYSKYFTIEESFTSFGEPLINSVGCGNRTDADVLACLRAVPAMALVSAPTVPSFIVVDRKFLTTDQLEVNGAGPAAHVPVIFGWMRDDGADFVGALPTVNSTLTTALLGAGFPFNITEAVVNSPHLFPLPSGSDPLLDLYNLTSRVGTDGEFKCIDQATLIAVAKHKVFPTIYAYQFDRSYDGFEPNGPAVCQPPIAPRFPNGNPSLPYFRCHGGEIFFMFGSLGQDSAPFRDPNDLIMSQVAVDMWSSFARTFNPTPSTAFLVARGYTNTTEVLRKAGKWKPLTPENPTPLRLLDIPLSLSPFLEEEQCSVLAIPFNFYG
ncbi:Alpha/Beta hydrolase protein [Gymnopilus junonius]|uniref:Carboxylic ester hydrolase n=1 Tax=Gymnopilus junonius TaxID=109634 RepID=A0A9P5P161_GYMJU|nr:Alpha/Beta hydrolase protein [Gymnopilus junonius]